MLRPTEVRISFALRYALSCNSRRTWNQSLSQDAAWPAAASKAISWISWNVCDSVLATRAIYLPMADHSVGSIVTSFFISSEADRQSTVCDRSYKALKRRGHDVLLYFSHAYGCSNTVLVSLSIAALCLSALNCVITS